jgi:hypothetical protein
MYDFTLQLPDGRLLKIAVQAEHWKWQIAFSQACLMAESGEGLPARSGIRCIDYAWQGSPAPSPS